MRLHAAPRAARGGAAGLSAVQTLVAAVMVSDRQRVPDVREV
jgi:hypothetical protein